MTREQWREEGFAFGEVKKESVYMLTGAKSKLPVPIPAVPNFKNHGNEVVSVSALARFQQRQAEEAGAYVLTETSATQLIVEDGKVVGVRSGDKGRGKDGEPLGNFEPGTDIKAKATVLAEGCWGHLTGAAIKEFDLAKGREPQVWELGVKEVWKVKKPLDRVIHTFVQPWPLKVSPKYGQLGGTWLYPMKDEKTGEDMVSIGFVVDLNYRDATTSAHDLLQTFKTHPLVKGILEGGERVAWGAKALPGGGYWSMPKLSMPGAVLVGDAGGMVDTAALKGVHHCIKSGMLAAEAIYNSLKRGQSLEPYEEAVEQSSIGKELYQVRNTRQAFQKGFLVGSLLAGPSIMSKGKVPPGRQAWHRDDAEPMFVGNTKDRYPKPDGKYTFDKLSSVFITGNATRDDAPNHIRVQKHVPREIAETWRWMCPRGRLRDPRGRAGDGRGGRDRQLHQLRAVRRDHRQGRASDGARGWRRAAVPDPLRGSRPNNCNPHGVRWVAGPRRVRVPCGRLCAVQGADLELGAALAARISPRRGHSDRRCGAFALHSSGSLTACRIPDSHASVLKFYIPSSEMGRI